MAGWRCDRGLTEVQVAFPWMVSRPSVASGGPARCCQRCPAGSPVGRRCVGLAPS